MIFKGGGLVGINDVTLVASKQQWHATQTKSKQRRVSNLGSTKLCMDYPPLPAPNWVSVVFSSPSTKELLFLLVHGVYTLTMLPSVFEI